MLESTAGMILLFLCLVVSLLFLLFLVVAEDVRKFGSEWHPFVDKKRRRIVLECTPTGWIVLQEILKEDTGPVLSRCFFAPWRPFLFLGWKKTVGIITKTTTPFESDVLLWSTHFGKKGTTKSVSILA